MKRVSVGLAGSIFSSFYLAGYCLGCEVESDRQTLQAAAPAQGVTVAQGATAPQTGGVWKTFADMNSERQEVASAVLNGKIYVLGGLEMDAQDSNVPRATRYVEAYNPATDTWAYVQDLPSANHHNAAAVAGGKLYAFGGVGKATFVYDPVNNSWTRVADTKFSHANTAAVGVINDKIYVAGGESDADKAEVYDPASDTWTPIASMKVMRHHCAGGVINGKFYVVAGRLTPASPTALEVYDPQTNNWTTLASMPTPRSGVAAAVVNGELYVFGGEGGGLHPEVEVYNPESNSWRRAPDMPIPRHGIWSAVIGNRIHLAGGGIAENYFPSEHHDAFIVSIKATFANISTRLKVEGGDKALIGGFIVTGTGTKRIMVRAIGPSVPLGGTLANPTLELYNGAGQLVATNDNWQDAPNKQEIIDSSIAPTNALESAILTTVGPGNHTAIVRGVGGASGVGLVEVYDLEAGSDSRLANIATRGFVETDPNVLIGGMIVDGQMPRKMVVRAIGPSLGRSDALADPVLELRDSNGGLLDSNDNWGNSPQAAEIAAAGLAPSNPLESAVVRTLSPASYTAIVRGQNSTTGIAVVEAYALD